MCMNNWWTQQGPIVRISGAPRGSEQMDRITGCYLSVPLPCGWVESSPGATRPQKASVPPTRKKFAPTMQWTSEIVCTQRCKGTQTIGFRLGQPLESVSSWQGCSDCKLQGVLGSFVDLQGRMRGLSSKTGVLLRRSGQVPWRQDYGGIRVASGEAGQGRERFVGGGLGLRQRWAAAQV